MYNEKDSVRDRKTETVRKIYVPLSHTLSLSVSLTPSISFHYPFSLSLSVTINKVAISELVE